MSLITFLKKIPTTLRLIELIESNESIEKIVPKKEKGVKNGL